MNTKPRFLHVSARAQNGTAVLVVLVLLGLLAALVMSNGAALRHLNKNMRRIEQKHLKVLAGPQTNTVPQAIHR